MTTPTARYDLYLHSYWSYDATVAVEAHFRCASELGVRCIAITEHHHMDSLPDVLHAARAHPEVRAILAAELTVTTSLGDVDLLCYGFAPNLSAELRDLFEVYHQWQRGVGAAISRGMQKLGHDFPDEERLEVLRSYRPARAIERQGNTHVKNPVLREHFLKRGFIQSEADYGSLWRAVWVAGLAPDYPPVDSVQPALRKAGVLVAVAHPYGYFQGNKQERMDALREESAHDGIECAHPSVPTELTLSCRAYCEKHVLVSVAGSDCHGEEDLATLFAKHGGADVWLDEFLERLDQH